MAHPDLRACPFACAPAQELMFSIKEAKSRAAAACQGSSEEVRACTQECWGGAQARSRGP